MKIVEMKSTPVAVTDPPLRNAAGMHAPYALRIIVEIMTNENISGLGEVPGNAGTLEALKYVGNAVVDMDPFHLNSLDAFLTDDPGCSDLSEGRRFHVASAIEVACFDIMGKVMGRPVSDLLGGAMRDRVPFSAYLFYKQKGAGGPLGFGTDPQAEGWDAARQEEALDPEGLAKQALAMVQEFGFQSIKLKGGVFEPAAEVAAVMALRDTFGPATPLRLDPNGIWSVATAVRAGGQLEGVLEYYEDPVRGQANMAKVKESVDIPMATNMCTTSFAHLPGSIGIGSEDIILADHHHWGGLRPSIALGRICKTFGRGLSMHSNSHLGVSLAAMTHLAAATPNLTYACDTHYPWQSEDVITGGRWKFEEGSLSVPREPGLGVELDREALARLHENYVACGLTERNDEVEMQKIEPGWQFQSLRW